jgi:hypothetical protein
LSRSDPPGTLDPRVEVGVQLSLPLVGRRGVVLDLLGAALQLVDAPLERAQLLRHGHEALVLHYPLDRLQAPIQLFELDQHRVFGWRRHGQAPGHHQGHR